jgi:hypothetical protein
VATRITKDLNEGVGRSVYDLRVAGEVRCGVDIAGDAEALNDAIKVTAYGVTQLRDEIQRTKPSRLLARLDFKLTTKLADKAALSVPLAQLPRQIDEVTVPGEGNVICARGAGLRKFQAKGANSVFEVHWHILLQRQDI